MKIVLCEHVDHLGERGETVSVAAGYARNYLLPKRLALPATPGNIKSLEHRRRRWEVKEARETSEAEQMAARLNAIELSVTKKAGEGGTLYGSVTTSEIAELLAAQGVEVDRRRLSVAEPIKSLGEHEVTIKLYRRVSAIVKVHVVGQSGSGVPVEEPDESVSEFANEEDY